MNRIVLCAVILLATALAVWGCSTRPPEAVRVEYREVKVPTPVSCVPKEFPRTTVWDDVDASVASAPSADERYRAALVGLELQAKRGRQSEVVVDGCRDSR